MNKRSTTQEHMTALPVGFFPCSPLLASLFSVSFLFLSFFLPAYAFANTCTWTGTTNSTWATTTNWNNCGGVEPQAADDVIINGGTNQPTLNLSGGAVTINSLELGSTSASTLTFSNGDTSSKRLIVTATTTIAANGTMTHTANTTTQTHSLYLDVGGNMTIESGGKIDVSGKGYAGGTVDGNGPGKGYVNSYGSGAGYGGNGGNCYNSLCSVGATYGSVTQPTAIGSSGGSWAGGNISGAGGGAIKVNVSGTLTISGQITANGGAPSNSGAGAGSGGSVYITAGTLSGSSSVTANGGSSGGNGGGGGGGRISLNWTSSTYSGITTAYGGTGYQIGGAGTVFTKATAATYGDLVVNNNSQNGANTTATSSDTFDNMTIVNYAKYIIPSGFTITLASTSASTTANASLTINSGGTFVGGNLAATAFTNFQVQNNGVFENSSGSLVIGSGCTWYENGTKAAIGSTTPITDITVNGTLEFQNQSTTTPVSFTSITINNGGTLTHQTNGTTQTDSLNLSLTTLTVNTGGAINVNNKGFAGGASGADGYGPGKGYWGGGGGYGGGGASGSGGPGGITYGSVKQPTDAGSGGAGSGITGGAGGGVVKLNVSGTLTLSGSITTDGESRFSNSPGGGSGGSVWITAGTLAGNGSITANGGSKSGSGGSGGGGRIAVYWTSSTYSGTYRAYGGNTAIGAAGTIFTKSAAATNGDLLIDNNGQNGTSTMANSSNTFDNMTIVNYAKYIIPSGVTITLASTSASTTANASLTINSGGTFVGAPTTFANFQVQNNGVFENSSGSLVIGSGCTWYENGTKAAIGSTTPITDITVNGTLEFQNQNTTGSAVSFNSVTVNNGGTLTHQANTTTQTDGLNLSLTTLTVNTGGSINVNNKGYYALYCYSGCAHYAGYGPGGGSSVSGFGAAYGGQGAGNNAVIYGSVTQPDLIGSSGGTTGYQAGAGGGAVKLNVSGTFLLNGSVVANGQTYGWTTNEGGGSGGSVWITAGTMSGSGTITSNGGGGNNVDAGAGGGRIALYYTASSYNGSITAYGGIGGSSNAARGGAGTIYLKGAAATYGDLIVNNNGSDGAYTTATSSNTFDNMTIVNYAKYMIPSGVTITLASTSASTTANSSMTISSGGTFSAANLTSFNSFQVTNNVSLSLPALTSLTSMTITNNSAATFTAGSLASTSNTTITNNSGATFTATSLSSTTNGTITNSGIMTIGTTYSMTGGAFYQNDTLNGLANLFVGNGSTFEFRNTSTTTSYTLTNLTIQSGGTLTHEANTTTHTDSLNLTVTNNLDVQSGGTISVSSRGLAGGTGDGGNGNGTGKGTGSASAGGGGAGYGGAGGAGQSGGAGGSSYGSSTSPTDVGSGGGAGDNSGTGGAGGGAIKLAVGNTATISGTLAANGGNGSGGWSGGGGGSGGSIYIIVPTFTGSGSMTAMGGTGNTTGSDGGGGSGGRIAIIYSTNTYSGTLSVAGGSGYVAGATGSIYPLLVLATNVTTDITSDSATANGTVSSLDLLPIIEHGHVWAATTGPALIATPTAQWKLNDNAGNTAVVEASGLYNGTSQRNTSLTATSGKLNGAMVFNGSSDYVTVTDTSALDITGPITMSAWIKTTVKDGIYRRIIDKSYTSGYVLNMVGDSSGKVMTEIQDVAAVGTTDVADGSWHMVTGIYDGSYVRIYVDGSQQGSTPYSGGISANAYNLTIGMDNSNYPGTEKFSGSIDDVRIYNFALSPAEVLALYHAGSGTEEADPSFRSSLGATTTTGTFPSSITGLNFNTRYYVRAYATLLGGTTYYGSEDSFIIPGSLTLGEHSQGQVTNQFLFLTGNNTTLFRFSLSPQGESATATSMVFPLTKVYGITDTKVSNIRLYRDTNANGSYDASDVAVGGAGVLALQGFNGSTTFSTPFLSTTTEDFILVADTIGTAYSTMMTISLPTSGVSATGVTTQQPSYVTGSVSSVEHRHGRPPETGGFPTGIDPIDGVSAAGVMRSGGSGGGGMQEVPPVDPGESIGNEVGFFSPTVSGSLTDEWTNGAEGMLSDGVYAEAASDNLLQSYSTFVFGVPDGNTITGIILKLEASGSTPAGTIDVLLSWDGGTSFTSTSSTAVLTASDVVYTFGGESDLWGQSWTPAYFADGTFVVRMVAHPSGNTIRLDALQVRPVHQAGGGGSGGIEPI